jgi:hypothetical protein
MASFLEGFGRLDIFGILEQVGNYDCHFTHIVLPLLT